VRIAATAEQSPNAGDRRRMRAVLDIAGTMPGRGAYLCRAAGAGEPRAECLALAARRRAIARALRAGELVESVGP
jgi:predicted RNA-binding protein YlxR (DUF448 family)